MSDADDRQESHHDLRPEAGRRLRRRIQDRRGRGAGDLIPRGETAALKYFQERMPYGLFVPDVEAR
jgi:hypothetical protein